MSFSFDPTLAHSIDIVRFHIGDTDENGYFLEDETIQYWITADGVNKAVISCIKYILSQLSKPDFHLDWLSVSGMAQAREGYEQLLAQKQVELGIVTYSASATISQPYRADSLQDTDDEDYHSEFEDE